MMAAKYGHIGVSALLDAGARIDARDRDGRSAEDVAAELGRQSVVELLRDARRKQRSHRKREQQPPQRSANAEQHISKSNA